MPHLIPFLVTQLLAALMLLLLAPMHAQSQSLASRCADLALPPECSIAADCLSITCGVDVVGESLSVSAELGLCGSEPVARVTITGAGLKLTKILTQDDVLPLPGIDFEFAGVKARVGLELPRLSLDAGPNKDMLGLDIALTGCADVPVVGRECRTLYDMGTVVIPVRRPDVDCGGSTSPFGSSGSGGSGGSSGNALGSTGTALLIVGLVALLALVIVGVVVVRRRNGRSRRRHAAGRGAAGAGTAGGKKRGRKPGTVDLAALEARAYGKEPNDPATAQSATALSLAPPPPLPKGKPPRAAPLPPAKTNTPDKPAMLAFGSSSRTGPPPVPRGRPSAGGRPPPRPAQHAAVASGWLAAVAKNENNASHA